MVPLHEHNSLKEKLAVLTESNGLMRDALALLKDNFAKMDDDRENLAVENESLRRSIIDVELLLDEKSSQLVALQTRTKYCQKCKQECEQYTI